MIDGVTFDNVRINKLNTNYQILYSNIRILKKKANFMSNYYRNNNMVMTEIGTVSRSVRRRLRKLLISITLADKKSPESFVKFASRLDILKLTTQKTWESATGFDWRLKDREFADFEEYQAFCDIYLDGGLMDKNFQRQLIYPNP